jgi:hypothetical protein
MIFTDLPETPSRSVSAGRSSAEGGRNLAGGVSRIRRSALWLT